jgi:hypothetical protein
MLTAIFAAFLVAAVVAFTFALLIAMHVVE